MWKFGTIRCALTPCSTKNDRTRSASSDAKRSFAQISCKLSKTLHPRSIASSKKRGGLEAQCYSSGGFLRSGLESLLAASRSSPRQSHESRKPPEQDQLADERLTALEGVAPGVGAGVAAILVLATCIGAGSEAHATPKVSMNGSSRSGKSFMLR